MAFKTMGQSLLGRGGSQGLKLLSCRICINYKYREVPLQKRDLTERLPCVIKSILEGMQLLMNST